VFSSRYSLVYIHSLDFIAYLLIPVTSCSVDSTAIYISVVKF
jgi:hypothetical protein